MRIIISHAADGTYAASIPALSNITSVGPTREAATLAALQLAMQALSAALPTATVTTWTTGGVSIEWPAVEGREAIRAFLRADPTG